MSADREAIAPDEIAARISSYIEGKLPGAQGLQLHNMERIAVGWSHETWLFDAQWSVAGAQNTQGFCLRRDPGNALLRELSDLGDQFGVLQCLEPTALQAPKPFWYEADHGVLGAPFIVMEKVPGSCPNPWGREGRAYY